MVWITCGLNVDSHEPPLSSSGWIPAGFSGMFWKWSEGWQKQVFKEKSCAVLRQFIQ